MNCTLLKGHTDIVLALITTKADPNILVTSSKDNSVRVWKMTKSPFQIACISVGNAHTGSVGSVALSRTKLSFLVSGSQDTCLKTWKMDPKMDGNNERLVVLNTVVAHDKDINSVCVSPNDNLIASGSQDKVAKIWQSSDLRLLGVLRGHRRGLWAVQFSPADQILASASTDCNIMLWSLTDYSCLKVYILTSFYLKDSYSRCWLKNYLLCFRLLKDTRAQSFEYISYQKAINWLALPRMDSSNYGL